MRKIKSLFQVHFSTNAFCKLAQNHLQTKGGFQADNWAKIQAVNSPLLDLFTCEVMVWCMVMQTERHSLIIQLRKKRLISITWVFGWTSVILNSTSRNVKLNVFAIANVHPLEAKWYACLYWHFCFQLTGLFNWLIYTSLRLISLLRQLVHPVLLNLAKWSFTVCLCVLSFPRLRINVKYPLDV